MISAGPLLAPRHQGPWGCNRVQICPPCSSGIHSSPMKSGKNTRNPVEVSVLIAGPTSRLLWEPTPESPLGGQWPGLATQPLDPLVS